MGEKQDDDSGMHMWEPIDTIESDRLRKLGTACPDCGAWSEATGKMYKQRGLRSWFIEYWCPDDRDFSIASPFQEELTREIARKHGRR